jgi:type IV pilus assembly protein PilC
MPTFSFQAINESGGSVSGSLEATSVQEANSALSARGLIPLKITIRTAARQRALIGSLVKRLHPVRMDDLILFTTQFRTMISAGVPMMTLLQTLETQTEDQQLRQITTLVRQDITEGASLHEALRKHPRVFSPLFCSMVRAGEASGSLPQVLDRLIYILKHEHKIRTDIRSALQYPAIVVIFLLLAFFVLLTYVIPKFSTIFIKSGLTLPLPTRVCVFAYNFLVHFWPIILLLVIGLATGITYYLKTPNGRLFKDKMLLTLPLIGPLFKKAAMSRFASIFAILQSSGVPVLDSMRILSETINNSAIAREFDLLTERLEEGRGISGPLRQSQYFTPIVINMTAIGEESGNLEAMLNDIATHYDTELEYTMKRFSDSLGPLLTVGLAVVIGFFALAIYLPMWDLSRVVQ